MLLQLCKELSWCHGGPRSELLSVGFVSIVFNYVGGRVVPTSAGACRGQRCWILMELEL